MKCSLIVNLLVVAALTLGGSVGCKRKPKSPTPIPARPGGAVGPGEFGLRDPGTEVIRPEPVEPIDRTNGGDVPEDKELPNIGDWNVDPTHFAHATVYFDFDRSTIKPSESPKIEEVGRELMANPNRGVRIEGHCDERGTEGYNLALGERRALAVREYLLNMGVSADRVDTVSYGEGRPAALGNTEEAYARNRRGEFLLLTPP